MSSSKDGINLFFARPIVIFVGHIILFALVVANVSLLIEVYLQEKQKERADYERSMLLVEIENLRDESNYENSELFKDKEISNQGYRRKGEVVVDTSVVELKLPDEVSKEIYIPELTPPTQNNFQKWIRCFFNKEGNDYGEPKLDNVCS